MLGCKVKSLSKAITFALHFMNIVTVVKHQSIISEQISLVPRQGINMLGTAVCSIILGAMLQSVGERGRPLLNVFEVLFDILMKLVKKFL